MIFNCAIYAICQVVASNDSVNFPFVRVNFPFVRNLYFQLFASSNSTKPKQIDNFYVKVSLALHLVCCALGMLVVVCCMASA